MEAKIITHHRYMSSELYSIGERNYFGCNGTLYLVTKDALVTILVEVKDMNPLQCAEYLIEKANQRFKKVSQ